jgi:hypothetical protein
MSLAIYAAPFHNDSNSSNNDYIHQKKRHMNKTQKARYTEGMTNYNDLSNNDRVNSVLQSIQNIPPPSSDDELSDFHPLPPPSSVGVMKKATEEKETKTKESMVPSSLQSSYYSNLDGPSSSPSSPSSQHDFYKRFIPNYEEMYKQSGVSMDQEQGHGHGHGKNPSVTTYYNHATPPSSFPSHSFDNKDILIEKLNYMIHLLEEQQDERTNNVTEEVILYSFLGIFIIFIVDSFARVGKYTR